MSLKAFHIVFIAASIVLAFGFAAWSIHAYRTEGGGSHLAFGVASAACGVGLGFYGRYVLKKLKHESYI
jgi:hypothetical protein